MTPPAPPGGPRAIWTAAGLDALAVLLDWIEQRGGDPDAREAEVRAAADAAAADPDIMRERWGAPPYVLRWRLAGAKGIVVYWHDAPGRTSPSRPGPVYILHVAHSDQADRMPAADIRRAFRQLGIASP